LTWGGGISAIDQSVCSCPLFHALYCSFGSDPLEIVEPESGIKARNALTHFDLAALYMLLAKTLTLGVQVNQVTFCCCVVCVCACVCLCACVRVRVRVCVWCTPVCGVHLSVRARACVPTFMFVRTRLPAHARARVPVR